MTNHGPQKARLHRHKTLAGLICLCLLLLCACGQGDTHIVPGKELHTSATFAMDTMVDQQAYGATAEDAMRQVNMALADWEKQMTRFGDTGDIARINAAAGSEPCEAHTRTTLFLQQAQALSAQSEGAFALTIEPLTAAWGVMSDAPRVPDQEEINNLLPLVDDAKLAINGQNVHLPEAGMGLDLGGIAKGAGCDIARDIYNEFGVAGALLNVGGNILAHGTKPDGQRFRIGIADPDRDKSAYIASFEMEDEVIALSGGYERYFEQGGARYIHIIDPRTGHPVETDIVSVGTVCQSGMEADFWSTTLFIWGKERTLQHMQEGNRVVMLDADKNLYVSTALQDSFEMHVDKGEYNLVFVEENGDA